MSNLENLRKQAKLFLRWHRDGHRPVAAQIRAFLPRYARLDDRAVMAAPFRLGDAQELVARQAGFASWQALKTGLQTMTDTPASASPTPFRHPAEPQLYVADFEAACAYYTERLGFEIVFTYGEPAFYGQIRRGQAVLNLRLVRAAVWAEDIREREELLAAAIPVGDAAAIRALFVEFKARDVDFFRPLKQEPWGARTFVVRDPDGNLLLFAGTAG
ncbi:MAG: VOC family protein [Reyranellaceae bacterium]